MKKHLFLTLISFVCIVLVSAQNKPTKGTSGIGLNYRLSQNVNFPVFKYDYYLTNSWVLTAIYKPSFVYKTSNDITENASYKYKEIRYSSSTGIGVEKHFFDKLKIDPFVGLSLYYGVSSKTKTVRINESKDILENTFYSKEVNTAPINISISPAVNLGFNYFILSNFSVGLQLNTGYSFGFVNGEETSFQYDKITDAQGNISRETENTNTQKRKNTSSNLFYNVALKTAFYFPVKKKEK